MNHFGRLSIGIIISLVGYIVGECIDFITKICGLGNAIYMVDTLLLLGAFSYGVGYFILKGYQIFFEKKGGTSKV